MPSSDRQTRLQLSGAQSLTLGACDLLALSRYQLAEEFATSGRLKSLVVASPSGGMAAGPPPGSFIVRAWKPVMSKMPGALQVAPFRLLMPPT